MGYAFIELRRFDEAIVAGKKAQRQTPSYVGGQALSDYPPLQCRCRSRARASLRNRHQGPSTMEFEDEVEQSFARPCRQFERQVQADMRTHLIHRPARDIFPLLGGSRVSSYRL